MSKRNSDASQTPPKSDLVDRRKGAYDNVVPPSSTPLKEHRDDHEPQRGSAAMPETDPPDESVPEGLQRSRKGAYSPVRGRSKE